MSIPHNSAILALLRAARWRIWAGRVLSRLSRAAWASALLLLCAGLLHALFYPFPWLYIAILAMLPPTAVILWGLLQDRPTLQDTAATADRWFEGKALMSTALDQLLTSRQQHTRASHFVIEAAEGSAPSWLDRLRRKHHWRPPRQAVIPLALGLAGVYLLLLPGPAARQNTAAIDPAPQLTSVPPSGDTPRDFVTGLREALRTARQASADPNPKAAVAGGGIQAGIGRLDGTQHGAPDTASISATRPINAAPVPYRKGMPGGPSSVQPTAATRSVEGISATAGTQEGRPDPAQNVISTAPPLAVEFFPLPRPKDEKDGTIAYHGASKALGPMTAILAPGEMNQAVTTARWDADMPYALALSPAQRQYIQQYFSSPGETQ